MIHYDVINSFDNDVSIIPLSHFFILTILVYYVLIDRTIVGDHQMETETSGIEGISTQQLKRYVDIRHRIDIEANSIYAITSLLALMDTCGDDTIEIDPVALGKINQILNKNILNIWELLDDFIYIVQARSKLEQLQNTNVVRDLV